MKGSEHRNNDDTSKRLIAELQLEPLAGESGYLAQIDRSAIEVFQNGRPFKANNSVYYLLDRDKPINYRHWLSPDDTHIQDIPMKVTFASGEAVISLIEHKGDKDTFSITK